MAETLFLDRSNTINHIAALALAGPLPANFEQQLDRHNLIPTLKLVTPRISIVSSMFLASRGDSAAHRHTYQGIVADLIGGEAAAHIRSIEDNEAYDTALPESIFADMHEYFSDMVIDFHGPRVLNPLLEKTRRIGAYTILSAVEQQKSLLKAG